MRRRLVDRASPTSLATAYVLSVGLMWAMLTPISGVADEPSHIIYGAGVARGDLGEWVAMDPSSNLDFLMGLEVPAWLGTITTPPITETMLRGPCFENDIEITANCSDPVGSEMSTTRLPSTATRYPPLYHGTVGVATLPMSGAAAIYGMRVISAFLAAAAIAAGLSVAAARRQGWLALGVVLAFTPLAGHFVGSVNPSALEISAAMGLGVALMGYVPDRDRMPLRTITVLSTLAFALAWARPRTYLTLLATVAAAAIVTGIGGDRRGWFRHRRVRITVISIAVAATASALAFERFVAVPFRNEITSSSGPGIRQGLGSAMSDVASRLGELTLDLFGRFGWLEHAAPLSLRLGWGIIIAAIVFAALRSGGRVRAASLGVVTIGALILAPLFVVMTSIPAANYQARYHLPVATLVVLGSCAVLASSDRGVWRDSGRALLRWAAVAAPLAMLLAAAASTYRHSLGGQAEVWDLPRLLFDFNEWLPPAIPLAIGAISVVVIAASSLLIGLVTRPGTWNDGGRADPDRSDR